MATETNVDIALRFIRAAQEGAFGSALGTFFTADAVQREQPNRLFPSGMTRDMQAMRESAARGRDILSSQRYEVRNVIAQGDQVALEMEWSGTLSKPVATLPAGATMKAYCGMFLTFRDGLIASVRNYDCYPPF